MAAVSDVDAVGSRRRQLRQQFAQRLAQRQVRLHLLVGLRVQIRQVHRVADLAGEQITRDDFGNLNAAFFLRLVRARAKVRRQNQVRLLAIRMVGGQRFNGVNIQRRAGDLVRFERRDQIRLDDDFAAGAIHDFHAGLHLGERCGVQHVLGFRCHRHMHGDEIRDAINFVHAVGKFRADGLGAILGEVRVIGDDAHAEGDGAFGDFGADAAHAEHAEGLAHEFNALEKFAVPFAGDHRSVRLRHLAREREQHGEAQFGGGHGIPARSVHHHRAVLRGSFDVHIVHAHAGAADHAQRLRRLDDFLGHLGFRADDERDGVRHERQQFGFSQPFGQHDDLKFRPLLQQFDAFRRNRITNDNFHIKEV